MKIRLRLRDVLLTAAVNAASAPPATFFYGGQAVIEGVLMRGRQHYAVAARKPDGQIAVCTDVLNSRVYTSKTWSLPFLRGVRGLYETLHLGMRALQWSVRVQQIQWRSLNVDHDWLIDVLKLGGNLPDDGIGMVAALNAVGDRLPGVRHGNFTRPVGASIGLAEPVVG